MDSIRVVNLGKAFRQYPNRWIRLAEWLLPNGKPRHHLHWVLRDINFTVKAGEAVGIIGINGAGKSTLLKIITGTTQPTNGSVHLNGRVAALLELGMGFHPEFTGRQNVFMAGQLLGHSVEKIKQLMPEIEAFAEIGDYIDQPLRIYSSGMQMRLAFSIATARRPDILIVDEALSVGDAYFQHKSFDRIRKFRNDGTTLLIVSHDKQAIQSICDRAFLIDSGSLAKQGTPEAVMDFYNAILADRQNQQVVQKSRADGRQETISGTGEAIIEDIALLSEQGTRVEIIEVGKRVTLWMKVVVKANLPRLVLGYMIKDKFGQTIFGTNTHLRKMPLSDLRSGEVIEYKFTFSNNIGPGNYSIATALTSSDTHLVNNYEWRDLALIFNVVNRTHTYFAGSNWIEPEIGICRP